MTNEEAIEVIKQLPLVRYEKIKAEKSTIGEALDMAIFALKNQGQRESDTK